MAIQGPELKRDARVELIAQDLLSLHDQLDAPVHAVVGHSFGGKVALAYAEALPPDLEQCWVLDSVPGPARGDTDDGEVSRVLRALRAVPLPIASRQALVDRLVGQGFSLGLSRWMTTNLQAAAGGGLTWRFALDAVEALIGDYYGLDLRDLLHTPVSGLELHVVRAARSDRWAQADVDEIEDSLATLHTLPDAGHWLHVDNPDGLLELMAPAFSD